MNNGYNNENVNNNMYNENNGQYGNQNTNYNNNLVNNPNMYNASTNTNMYNANTNTIYNNQNNIMSNGMINENKIQKPENFIMGIVGALGGALIGSIVLVILYQIGLIASISGLIMAALAGVCYEKLGGHMSKKGAIASIIVVLVVIFFSYNVAVALEVVRGVKELGYDLSFFEALTNIFTYLENGVLDTGAYWGNLGLVYLFGIFGAVGLLKK